MKALQEISVEDRRRKLENSQAELASVNARISDVNTNLKGKHVFPFVSIFMQPLTVLKLGSEQVSPGFQQLLCIYCLFKSSAAEKNALLS